MPIEWPIASSFGQLYTSPNLDKWRWNGYAWDNLSLQSSGNYGGSWVIFDRVWNPTYYSTLQLALAGAIPGDTIYLCCDTSETYTLTTAIMLKNGVNINLNGNKYTFVFSGTSGSSGLRTPLEKGSLKIQNGTIEFSNIGDRYGIFIVTNTEADCTGLTVTSSSPSATVLVYGSIKGGSYFNTATTTFAAGIFILAGSASWINEDDPKNYARDIKGWSLNGPGVQISATLSLYE